MTEHDVPPLDADVRALLERSRGVVAAPAGAAARVLAGVEAAVLHLPPGGGGGGGGSGSARAVPGADEAARAGAGVLRRLLPWAATFTLGAAVGAGAVRATFVPPAPVVVETPPRIVVVERPAASPPAQAGAPSVAATPPTSAHAAVALALAAAQDSLAAERALLDVARGALERQDGAAALAATREHERRFPSGLLSQERDAMTVRALVLLGRRDEARGRADRFRARYPGSVLTPALDSQVAAPSSSSP